MSPQMTTLGTIGVGVGSSISYRTKSSGIYRPEDNALIQNYKGIIDSYRKTEILRIPSNGSNWYLMGLHFNQTGNYFHVADADFTIRQNFVTNVYTYQTTKPWSVDSANVSRTNTFQITSSNAPIRGMTATNDLYNFYFMVNNGRINRYTIRSGRESFAGVFTDTNYSFQTSYNISSNLSSGGFTLGIKLNSDNSKLYAVENTSSGNGFIHQYNLNNGVVSTFNGKLTLSQRNRDIAFNGNGRILYIMTYHLPGSNSENTMRIEQKILSTPWDILSGNTHLQSSHTSDLDLNDSLQSQIYYKSDGLSFYIIGTALSNSPLFPGNPTKFPSANVVGSGYNGSIIKYDLITN